MASRTATRFSKGLPRPGFLGWGGGSWLSWPARGIRWKIILPYAVLVVVLAAAGTYLSTSLVQGSLNERFENQLVEASRVSSDTVVRTEDTHLSVARSVAFTQGLPQAIESRDAPAVTSIINAIAANTTSERIEVLNAAGARVAGLQLSNAATLSYTPTTSADDPSKWPLVGLALDASSTGKYAQIVDTTAGPMLMTASPVFDGTNLVGAVLVGTSLKTLTEQMKAQALADLTIYDPAGNPIASTFVPDQTQANLNADPVVLASADAENSVVRDSRVLWGRRYDLVYGDLQVQGHNIGYYSVALPSDFIFSASSGARWKMTLLFGIGMALVLGTGFVLASSLTRRIQQLVKTAEQVTDGDLSARTVTTSDDELGKLAACLNRMTDRLEGQYMATMRALASAVAGSNPYTVRHAHRVGQLATLLGKQMHVDDRTQAQLEIGGYLHDIGKIGVRDSGVMTLDTLLKADKQFIDSHPHIGLETPQMTSLRAPVMDFIGGGTAGGHDGFGIVARIIAVADLYDALTADRPDSPPMTSEEALVVLRASVGPALHFGTVEALAHILPEWERAQGRGSDVAVHEVA